MTARCAPAPNPGILYFAEIDYGKLGKAFQELDRDSNSREAMVKLMRSSEVVLKILQVDEQAHTARDVTDEILAEALTEREAPTLSELAKSLADLRDDMRNDLRKDGLMGIIR